VSDVDLSVAIRASLHSFARLHMSSSKDQSKPVAAKPNALLDISAGTVGGLLQVASGHPLDTAVRPQILSVSNLICCVHPDAIIFVPEHLHGRSITFFQ
jgi:hypothetical protein